MGSVIVNTAATVSEEQAAATKQRLTRAVQRHMDTTVQERGYDNIFTACTYAEEPAVPEFQAEGQACREWRSRVWDYCYAVLADVESGSRAVQTEEELIAELPVLTWP